MERRNALGKGLNALFPGFQEEKVDTVQKVALEPEKTSTKQTPLVENKVDNTDRIMEIPLSKVERNPHQPRVIFSEGPLQELADSIRENGVITPILVSPVGDHYEIIAGERRWRAAKIAGLSRIPVVIRTYSARTAAEVALIENIQRENLNAIEEAQAYQRLQQEYGMTQEELSVRLSRSRSLIANRLRLLKLDERVEGMLMEGSITEGHARALLALENKKLQAETAQRIAEEHLSVRETERLVKRLLSPAPVRDRSWQERDRAVYDELEQKLRKKLGAKVSIRRKTEEKGQMIIDYYSVDELELLTQLLMQRGEES